jgi:hypothetical protein
MCDDVAALVARLKRRRVGCEPVRDLGWGRLTRLTLPGGGELGVYEPLHARPQPMKPRRSRGGRKPGAR